MSSLRKHTSVLSLGSLKPIQPSPESLGPGTDTALSPQSTIALPQSLELGTTSALSPQSTVAKMGKLVLRVEKEMNAKLLQGELPTWTEMH